MTNNDVIRRIRYIFDYSDKEMIATFSAAEHEVTREQVSAWLKSDDDEALVTLNDIDLASFLNGFINIKRGKKEGEQPTPEKRMNNNLVLTKLKIALNFKADEMLEVLNLAGFTLSKHELSAFFRKKGHKHFRACKDQVLRNFLQGLQLKYRDNPYQKKTPSTNEES